MVMWQQPKSSRAEEIDEHNQPTEPIQRIVLPAFIPPAVQAGPLPEDQANAPTLPPQAVPPARADIYPVLPPLPAQAGKARAARPAGGADKAAIEGVKGQEKKTPSRRRPVPILVGLFFVMVQLLLLTRFVLSFLNISTSSGWGEGITTVNVLSDAFLLPLRLLFEQITLPVPVDVRLYALLAILVYGLISRLLVRLLKMLLR